MRLVMVDADEWLAQRERHRLRRLETDEQRDAQPRPLRRSDGVELRGRNFRLNQRGLRHGQKIFQMLARGKFRHHAAVFRMQFDLRRDHVGQHFAVAHHGGAGFVAGSFKREQSHLATGCSEP